MAFQQNHVEAGLNAWQTAGLAVFVLSAFAWWLIASNMDDPDENADGDGFY